MIAGWPSQRERGQGQRRRGSADFHDTPERFSTPALKIAQAETE